MVVLIRQSISTRKCWEPVPATFNILILAPRKRVSKSFLFKISNTFWSQNRKKEKLNCNLTILNCFGLEAAKR